MSGAPTAAQELQAFTRMWLKQRLVGQNLSVAELYEALIAMGPFVGTLIGEYSQARANEDAKNPGIPEEEWQFGDVEGAALLNANHYTRTWTEELPATAQRFIRQFPRSLKP